MQILLSAISILIELKNGRKIEIWGNTQSFQYVNENGKGEGTIYKRFNGIWTAQVTIGYDPKQESPKGKLFTAEHVRKLRIK